MSILDWFRPRAQNRAAIASVRGAVTPNSADIPENEIYWRRAGARIRQDYDLTDVDHERAQKDAIRAWRASPILKRYLDIKAAYVVGVQRERRPQIVRAKNETLATLAQTALDEFWRRNQFDRRLPEWCIHVHATGEGFAAMHVGGARDAQGRGSRKTRVAWLDPIAIRSVVTDPEDHGTRIGALSQRIGKRPLLWPFIGPDHEIAYAPFRGIRENGTVSVPGIGVGGASVEAEMGAPCIYLPANATPGQTRGIPDAYDVLDLLGVWQDYIWGASERHLNMNAVVHHVVLEGASPPELDEAKKSHKRAVESGAGQALFTNEKVRISSVAPSLQSVEYATWEKVLVLRIAAGLGIPEHWLSEAGDANTATASEMSGPTLLALAMAQDAFMGFVEAGCWFALTRVPEIATALRDDPDAFGIHIPRPDLVSKDALRQAAVLTSRLGALAMTRSQRVLTPEAVQRLWLAELQRHDFVVGEEDLADAAEMDLGVPGLVFPPSGNGHESEPGNLAGFPRSDGEQTMRDERVMTGA